jgi:hypothetical protein
LLEISAENQRVLLHRARGRIRATIDSLVGITPAAVSRASPSSRRGRTTQVASRYVAAALRLLTRLQPAGMTHSARADSRCVITINA